MVVRAIAANLLMLASLSSATARTEGSVLVGLDKWRIVVTGVYTSERCKPDDKVVRNAAAERLARTPIRIDETSPMILLISAFGTGFSIGGEAFCVTHLRATLSYLTTEFELPLNNRIVRERPLELADHGSIFTVPLRAQVSKIQEKVAEAVGALVADWEEDRQAPLAESSK